MRTISVKIAKSEFIETSTAVFIIAAVSLFILANFVAGFNFPIYFFAMAAGFALSIVFPRSGFYAIVFLTVIFERFFTLVPIYWNRTEYKIYPIDILFAGVMLGTIYQIIKNGLPRKLKIVDYLIAIFILASAVYFLASAFFLHADEAIAFSTFKNYSFYGLFYFAFIFLFSEREKIFQLLKFFLAAASAASIFIFIGIIRGEGLWTEFTPLSTPGTRILAFPHAFYFSMALLASFVWLSFKKSKVNKFLYALIPIWTAGIIGSLMRHLWISLFISVLFLFYLLPQKNSKTLKTMLLHYAFFGAVLFILAAYISFIFPQSGVSKVFRGAAGVAGQRFVSTAQVSSDESLNWRKSVWEAAWTDFQHSLIFGLGYGKMVSVEIGLKYKDFIEVRNIHNSLLTMFIQMGIWSIALITAIFYSIFRPLYSNIRKPRKGPAGNAEIKFFQVVFVVLFINYLIAFLFQTYLETNLLAVFFWIILGGLAVLGGYPEEINKNIHTKENK
ncbi:MAG: O-antigen ligase family protein [Parcubacteria group bacterium]|jgi:O-antigen ligase